MEAELGDKFDEGIREYEEVSNMLGVRTSNTRKFD
jgi:hypothetical protein